MAQQTDADRRTEAVNEYVTEIAALPDDVEGRVAPLGQEAVETRSQGDGTLLITVAEELADTHSWSEIQALIQERQAEDRQQGMGW